MKVTTIQKRENDDGTVEWLYLVDGTVHEINRPPLDNPTPHSVRAAIARFLGLGRIDARKEAR